MNAPLSRRPPATAAADCVAAVRPPRRSARSAVRAVTRGMIKLDAMENPVPAASADSGEARGGCGRRCRSTAIRMAARRAVHRPRCATTLSHSRSRWRDPRQRLRRADPDHHARACARPGAAMLAPEPSFVMYRMNALFAGMRLRRRAARPRLRARRRRRCERRSSASGRRSSFSRIRTTRRATCSTRTPSRRILRERPGSSSSTRRTTRSPTRASCRALARVSQPASCCARCRRSAWRACASATRSARTEWIAGARTRCASRIISTR